MKSGGLTTTLVALNAVSSAIRRSVITFQNFPNKGCSGSPSQRCSTLPRSADDQSLECRRTRLSLLLSVLCRPRGFPASVLCNDPIFELHQNAHASPITVCMCLDGLITRNCRVSTVCGTDCTSLILSSPDFLMATFGARQAECKAVLPQGGQMANK